MRLEPATTEQSVIRVPLPFAAADAKIRVRTYPGRFEIGIVVSRSNYATLLLYSVESNEA